MILGARLFGFVVALHCPKVEQRHEQFFAPED